MHQATAWLRETEMMFHIVDVYFSCANTPCAWASPSTNYILKSPLQVLDVNRQPRVTDSQKEGWISSGSLFQKSKKIKCAEAFHSIANVTSYCNYVHRNFVADPYRMLTLHGCGRKRSVNQRLQVCLHEMKVFLSEGVRCDLELAPLPAHLVHADKSSFLIWRAPLTTRILYVNQETYTLRSHSFFLRHFVPLLNETYPTRRNEGGQD